MDSAHGEARPPNFDRLARAYRWMEYLSFGPMLERCRFRFLDDCGASRHALLLGDGDGRFAARLFAINRDLRADAVDGSQAMLDRLRQRVVRATQATTASRLRTMCADLRRSSPPGKDYDLVVSHFFLDCLTDRELESLLERTLPALAPRCLWLVSEFSVPQKGWRGPAARLLIRSLYFAFRRLTHLQVRQVPDYSLLLTRNGFQLRRSSRFLGGILSAELWERKAL